MENRERLCRLLGRLLVGCRSERVRLKLERVMVSLRYGPVPWCLSRAGWLDIGDLPHLAIDFPLVVWGRDMGGGLRRVRYPQSGITPMLRTEGERLSVSEGHIVLDSEHFFPLDEVLRGEGADSVMELACGGGARSLREARVQTEGEAQGGVTERGGVGCSAAGREEGGAGQEVQWARADGGAVVERVAGVRRAGQDVGEAAGRGRGRKAARGADGLAVGAGWVILPTEGVEPPD